MRTESIAVSFPNKDGLRLFGILHQPERRREDGTAILLLSPGVKMRVAPHRLYVKMAERFVALGYPVLRFDFHGLGDAEGEANEPLLADLYGATQLGRYVADTVSAMDWMSASYGSRRFIAAGLCGGALTGLLAAQQDERVVSLLALSIPVILDGSNIDAAQFMTTAQLEGTRTGYLKKLSPWHADAARSWIRLLTFQSDYRMIARALAKPVLARLRPSRAAGMVSPSPSPVQPADNTNPRFAPAFARMVSTSRRVCLIFAESDRLFFEFEHKFMARYRAALEPHEAWYSVHVTKQANHIFSFSEWQTDMLDESCRWLEAGADRRAAGAFASV